MSHYYLSNSIYTLNDIFDSSNTSGSPNTGFYQSGSLLLYTPSTFTGNIGNAATNNTGYYYNNVDLCNIYSSKYAVFLNTNQNSIMQSLNTGSSDPNYYNNEIAYTSWQDLSGINHAPISPFVPTKSYTYTLPSYCKSFSALLFGGGGGGGPGHYSAGGGGGGGGFSVGFWNVVSGQTSVSITTGSGGLGGSNISFNYIPAQNGNNTTVTYNGITVTAYGGSGGVYNAGSPASGGSSTNTTIKSVSYNGNNGNNGTYGSSTGYNYGGTVGYPVSSSQYPSTSNMTTLIGYTFIPTTNGSIIGIGSGGVGSDQPITYSNGLGLPGMAVLFFYF